MSNRVAVSGATGRLGSLVCEVVEEHPDFELVARLSSTSAPEAGADAEILIDVTHPDVSEDIVSRALARGQRVIVGTSGWSSERLAVLERRVSDADGGAIVVPNFSLGSVLGTALARAAAPYFDAIEIIEAHHPQKVDSPSGTAVRTAELVAEARAGRPVDAPFAEQPARGELVAGIPVHSLRLAGVVAKQEVRFGGPGEVLTVTHDTHSNDAYRAGIRAALEFVTTASGLTVGLDRALGLEGLGRANSSHPAEVSA
ncbi:dihydrodipicolinate reductase [Leucobacter luti]|uniref:4-hydroxy-tetrahydrodipicolinate reductase n=1 Tax=Leucobacter luti TaxID=340320 RepID=UPI001042D5E3|nr:4-hydroxy-tetrahydrodipicolinate reductase [Leucobacter luti]MCW2287317.1 4-hydroxy-tetrahydrodipicolinate reductase [Leucobacter luti]TCK41540.1 dihydrodipicolinate reductase [Leucobacter luti]